MIPNKKITPAKPATSSKITKVMTKKPVSSSSSSSEDSSHEDSSDESNSDSDSDSNSSDGKDEISAPKQQSDAVPAIPSVKKNHKPRSEDKDFDVKSSDPVWMTTDIKRLTRTRSQTFLTRWIEESRSAAQGNPLKKMQPLKHENFWLDDIQIKPPHGAVYEEMKDFDEVVNKLKWAEITRFMQIWSQNPDRIPRDPITAHLPENQQRTLFTIAEIKVAKADFDKILKIKKSIKQDKKARKYHKISFVPEIQASANDKKKRKQPSADVSNVGGAVEKGVEKVVKRQKVSKD